MEMAKTKSNSPINLKYRETNLTLQLVIVVLETPRRRPVKQNKTGEQETLTRRFAPLTTEFLHPDWPLLASFFISSIRSTILANLCYEFLRIFPSTWPTGKVANHLTIKANLTTCSNLLSLFVRILAFCGVANQCIHLSIMQTRELPKNSSILSPISATSSRIHLPRLAGIHVTTFTGKHFIHSW